MKFRNIITIAAIALLPVIGSAATLVVPAAGTGPGGSYVPGCGTTLKKYACVRSLRTA